MVKTVSTVKDYFVRALNGLGEVFDAIAGLAPEPWDKIFGFAVTVVGTFGVFHFANPGTVVRDLTAFTYAVVAIGVAGKVLVSDLKPSSESKSSK